MKVKNEKKVDFKWISVRTELFSATRHLFAHSSHFSISRQKSTMEIPNRAKFLNSSSDNLHKAIQ